MKVTRENKSYELPDEAWNTERFRVLQMLNPKGKVVVIDDEKREKYLVPIGSLELQ